MKHKPSDYAAFLGASVALVTLVLLGLGLLVLAVWAIIASGAIILKFLGAVVIIVVASAAYQQITGKR